MQEFKAPGSGRTSETHEPLKTGRAAPRISRAPLAAEKLGEGDGLAPPPSGRPGRAQMAAARAVRGLFDMAEEDVYLACASRAPLARRTLEVGVGAAAQKARPWTLSGDGVDDRVRAAFAELVGCSAQDVALCPSTSFALTTAAGAVAARMQPGDVGLVLEDQMSSNVYPWQRLQESHGLDLQAVPYPEDGDWSGPLLRRLASLEADGRRVAVVAVPVYLWTDGSGPLDLAALSAACRDPSRRARTMLVVDATQSLGAAPLDVRATPVDFLAASVHKWLFGAYGLSCLFVAPELWADERLRPLVEDEHPRAHMAGADDEVAFDPRLPGYKYIYIYIYVYIYIYIYI